MTQDDLRWEQEAIEAQHKSLSSVRATAAAWSGSIAALLGIFSIVAFIKGPETLSSLDQKAATAVTILVLTAALLAIVATLAGAIAAQGTPHWLDRLDGRALRAANRDAAKKVVSQLWISRVLALLAAMFVLAAMSTAWLSTPREDTPSVHAMILTRAGAVQCGVLGETVNHEIGLFVDGKPPLTLFVGIDELITVEQCP
ncbi:MAG TPA: hypothetical protein VK781_08065 [Solirubrobacteraceae bacterium]|nr:hypothetical protein [Solirubrobacteraceae bacterium]